MDTVTLKRGRGTVKLVKSEDLIAIRPTSQAEVAEVLAAAPTEMAQVDTGTSLGGFQIVKVKSTSPLSSLKLQLARCGGKSAT